MADRNAPEAMQGEWTDFMTQMNEQLRDTLEANAQAQAEFIESWFDTAAEVDEGDISGGMEGYARAYEVWMDAAQESVEQVTSAAESGEVSPDELRDLWLDTANEAFKEVVSTEAFAAFSGQALEDMLELRQAADEQTQETLHDLGFATERDAREIGERLAELENRQQRLERKFEALDDVERKLDRVLDHLEAEE